MNNLTVQGFITCLLWRRATYCPFFALGIFLHALQDSFTTVKDRGCEWFYPLTRTLKLGTYDADGNPQPNIEPGKVYFYQEDVKGIIEKADPDLRILGDAPTL